MPCDETERDRLDVLATMVQTVRERGKRVINAPFRERRPSATGERSRVLDLGCGTGVWLSEMAKQFPDTELVGIDLNRMGPTTLLGNVDIRVPVDYESPWTLGEESWDLIHMQLGLGSVSMWPNIYQKIFRHLVPGGWFESVEIDFAPRCDDHTLPNGRLLQWHDFIAESYTAGSRSILFNRHTADELRLIGFKDVQHSVYRIPLNPWVPEGQDKAQHRAGNWWHIAMCGAHEGHAHGMEAMSLAPLTRFNRWSPGDVLRLCREAMAEASDPRVHAYNLLHVIIARRPFPDEPS